MENNELLYNKFLRALQEDMEQDTPYLVSAMVNAMASINNYIVLDEGFAARKLKKILSMSSHLQFFNSWMASDQIWLMAHHLDRHTEAIEKECYQEPLIKVLVGNGISVRRLRYDDDYTRVDFDFTMQDIVSVYSHYMGTEATEDDVKWLRDYNFKLWEPFDFCI
jgi:hypothetical protein